MITTSKGHPVEFIITPASVAGVTVFKIMEISLPFGSTVYGDKGYTSYLFEDERLEFEGIKLTPDRRLIYPDNNLGAFAICKAFFEK